jgi:amino acid transporter
VLALLINRVGTRFVDRAQSLIVVVLLSVFGIFIYVTITELDTDLLAFSTYPALSDIVASVALTFFAFLGFSVPSPSRPEISAIQVASCRGR